MYKNHITEEAWRKIYSFLQKAKEVYCRNEAKIKRFFDGVFWIMRTGAQWRELPEKFGKWNSVFQRFNEWCDKHIWEILMEFCAQDPDLDTSC